MSAQRRKQISDAVRILQRKRDASARATHLKAEIGMVPNSTIERKIMSTKTSIKRIALVAAAALTLGGFSAVSAHATANTAKYGYASTATTVGGTALTSAPSGTTYAKNLVVASTALASFTAPAGSTIAWVLTSGSGSFSASTTVNVALNGVTVAQVACTVSTTTCTTASYTAPTVAGTYTVTLTPSGDSNSFASSDLTWSTQVAMTITAASVYSSGTSSAYVLTEASASGTTATSANDTGSLTGTKNLDTLAGIITVTVKNADGTVCTSCLVGGYITGAGYIAESTNSAGTGSDLGSPSYVRSLTALAPHSSDGQATIGVYGDGTAGTGTITIQVTDAAGNVSTMTTKSVVFYGSVASLKVISQPYGILYAGGNTSGVITGISAATLAANTEDKSPAFVVEALDSNGNPVSGLTLSSTISDNTVISAVASNEDTSAHDTNLIYGGLGFYLFNATTASTSVSGKSATVTVKILNPADSTNTTYLTTAPVTFTTGGAVATQTIALDNTSYTAGAQMTLTITAKDSAGNPVYDDAPTPTTFTSNAAIQGLPTIASAYVGGVKSYNTVYAPATAGDFTITATGTDKATTKVTATANVAESGNATLALDAANAATDAANNAYDEAQNATQAASDALAAVNALAEQVKALIALVTKIKNKIKA
jgi:trimeric autotransporter adhesin